MNRWEVSINEIKRKGSNCWLDHYQRLHVFLPTVLNASAKRVTTTYEYGMPKTLFIFAIKFFALCRNFFEPSRRHICIIHHLLRTTVVRNKISILKLFWRCRWCSLLILSCVYVHDLPTYKLCVNIKWLENQI